MDLETYSNKLSAFIAGSYITSALTLGKELGLFDELKRLEKPVSAHQLADTCNLKERYVREWLGCMASTSIVSIDEKDHYFIPHSLKPGLHVVDCAFFFPVMATLTKKVANCFRKDGPRGYSYDEMPPDVIDVLEEKIPDVDKAVEQLIVPIMDFKESLATILDLGSGSGNVSRALSRRFPEATIYGIDYNEMAIAKAISTSKTQGIKNVKFLTLNATPLPVEWTQKFDWVIMYDVLHDLPDPASVMKEVYRVLKDDGVASINDPGLHSNHRDNVGDTNVAGAGYAISTVICLPCSLSADDTPGHGMGWGYENKEALLTSSGWRVKDKRNIESHMSLNFTCVKEQRENYVI